MKQRERVLTVLRHGEPDRVPFYLALLSRGAYANFCRHFGLDPLPPEPGGTTARYDERILDILEVDYRHLFAVNPPAADLGDGLFRDEWGIIWRDTGSEVGPIAYPLRDAISPSELAVYPWPDPALSLRLDGLRERARQLHSTTDYAVSFRPPLFGGVLELGCFLRGTDRFLVDLLLNKAFAKELVHILTGLISGFYESILCAIGEFVHIVEYATDYGHQEGLLISPDLYREFFKPADAAIIATIKKNAPRAKVCFHSCGAIAPLIPDFIETGAEILNALQPLAKNMDMTGIKRQYGGRLVFHGAIDVQRAMSGSVEDVRSEVRTRITELAPGGGYILAPSNILQRDVPVENIVALGRACREYGVYPLAGRRQSPAVIEVTDLSRTRSIGAKTVVQPRSS